MIIALANHYESKDKHYLAAPLYLQALTMSPPKSCHTAVLSTAPITPIPPKNLPANERNSEQPGNITRTTTSDSS